MSECVLNQWNALFFNQSEISSDKGLKGEDETWCNVLKAGVCLWKIVYWKQFEVCLWKILELWLSFHISMRIKRYKIIHLKEEGYSMCQIAAKVPMWPFCYRENFEKIFWNKFYCGQGLIRQPRKTSLREDRLLQRISLQTEKLIQCKYWNNGLWHQMWVCVQNLFDEDW